MSAATSVSPDLTMKGTESVTPYLWGMFGLCFVGNVMGGTVSTLMSVYLPVVVADISNDNTTLEHMSALLSALYFVGWAIGGLTMGVIADRVGRVRSLAIAVAIFG